MRRLRVAVWLPLFCLGLLVSGPAAAGTDRVTLPVGTKARKVGPGHYRFLLPDGKSVEVRNFDAGTGIIGDCGLFDSAGRKLSGGKNGKLVGGPAVQGIPGKGAAKIDDEITWLRMDGKSFRLPAVVEVIDPDPPLRPAGGASGAPGLPGRGLSPQPDPPGRR